MRVIAITLGYVPARIFRECIKQYKSLSIIKDTQHYFLNQHYPLNHDQNQDELKSICDEHGLAWMDSGTNMGLSGGWNYVQSRIGLQADDVVIGFDPDCYPVSPGFDMALVTAMQDAKVGWASLFNPHSHRELTERGYSAGRIGQIDAWYTKAPCLNSICAFKGSFLIRTGGLHEPRKWYGGLEMRMWKDLCDSGMKWVFLPQYQEVYQDSLKADPEYTRWKWYYAHEGKLDYDFGEYVRRGCPIL